MGPRGAVQRLHEARHPVQGASLAQSTTSLLSPLPQPTASSSPNPNPNPDQVHRSSRYAIAAPLRRGEDFCGHHDPKKFTGVRCAGMKKHGKGQCNVWSGSCYQDAAPLRRGSLYCHHHRVRCAGLTRMKARCRITSSSEHAGAEPLRRGEMYCVHHQCNEPSQRSQEEEAEGYDTRGELDSGDDQFEERSESLFACIPCRSARS